MYLAISDHIDNCSKVWVHIARVHRVGPCFGAMACMELHVAEPSFPSWDFWRSISGKSHAVATTTCMDLQVSVYAYATHA